MGDLLLEQQLTPQQQALLVTIPRVAFYFVRHGKTDWNLANRVQGSTDIPLNELGKQQAVVVAKLLMSHDITSICYSPLSRAKVTAEIINNTLNGTMYEIDDLKERSLGSSEGKEKPDGLDYVLDQPTEFFVDAEPRNDFLVRVVRGVARALELPDPVCIVSHGGVFRFLSIHFDIEPSSIANASIVQFIPQDTGWSMVEIAKV